MSLFRIRCLLVYFFSLFISYSQAAVLNGPLPEILREIDGPFYATSDLIVPINATATIEAGVVLKFHPDCGMRVEGALIIQSTPDKPVVFTSIHDDQYGGDFEDNGDVMTPHPGDWKGLHFSTPSYINPKYIYQTTESIHHIIVRYAGGHENKGGIIYERSTYPSLFNSTIEYCEGGITVSGVDEYHNQLSKPFIQDCIISQNQDYPIRLNNFSFIRSENNRFLGNEIQAAAMDYKSGLYNLDPMFLEITPISSENDALPFHVFHANFRSNLSVLIHAGSIFQIDAGESFLAHPNLTVEGEPDNPVIFTSMADVNPWDDSPAPLDSELRWRGVSWDADQDETGVSLWFHFIIKHCQSNHVGCSIHLSDGQILHAEDALSIMGDGFHEARLERCRIARSDWGVTSGDMKHENSISIQTCSFFDCAKAGLNLRRLNVSLQSTSFAFCEEGARLSNCEAVLDHCQFAGNEEGLIYVDSELDENYQTDRVISIWNSDFFVNRWGAIVETGGANFSNCYWGHEKGPILSDPEALPNASTFPEPGQDRVWFHSQDEKHPVEVVYEPFSLQPASQLSSNLSLLPADSISAHPNEVISLAVLDIHPLMEIHWRSFVLSKDLIWDSETLHSVEQFYYPADQTGFTQTFSDSTQYLVPSSDSSTIYIGALAYDNQSVSLPSMIEIQIEGAPLPPDPDQDGLNTQDEIALGTNPSDSDTDGDGLLDGEELSIYHTNPRKYDTDGDSLSDGVEIALGSNPNLMDSDEDGIEDGRQYGMDESLRIVGSLFIQADSFHDEPDGRVRCSGNVEINHSFLCSGDLIYDPDTLLIEPPEDEEATLSIAIEKLSGRPLPLFSGFFTLDGGGLALSYSPGLFQSDIQIAGLGVEIETLSLIFGNNNGIRIDGVLELPEIVQGVEIEVNGVQITEKDGLEFSTTIEIESLSIGKTPWSLKDVKFTYNSMDDLFSGAATLKLPALDLSAEVEIVMGELNKIGMGLSGLTLPIGQTGFYLNKIFGSVDNLAVEDPIVIIAGVGITGGGSIPYGADNKIWIVAADPLQIYIDLAGKIGAGGELHLFQPEEEIQFDIKQLGLKYQYNGIKLGEAAAEIDIPERIFKAAAGLYFDASLLEFTAQMGEVEDARVKTSGLSIDLNGVVQGNANGKLKVSEKIPLIGDIAAFLGSDQITMNAALTNKGIGGEIHISFIDAAIFLECTGNIRIGDNLQDVTPQAKRFRRLQSQSYSETHWIEAFAFEKESDFAAILLTWSENDADFSIRSPQGILYSPDAQSSDVIYVKNAKQRRAWYFIRKPVNGKWEADITYPETIGSYALTYYLANIPPQISGLAVEAIDSNQMQIEWDANDPDNDASISLYYDNDLYNHDGVCIVHDLAEDEGPSSYRWNTSSLKPGVYYLYAEIDDGLHQPRYNYCSTPIQIKNPNYPLPPNCISSYSMDQGIVVTWEDNQESAIVGYRVYITDDLISAHPGRALSVGLQKRLFLDEDVIQSGRRHRIVVTAFDENGLESDFSESIFATYQNENPNHPPVFSHQKPLTALINSPLSLPYHVEDVDGESIVVSLSSPPAGCSLREDANIIEWTPTQNQLGMQTIHLLAEDPHGATDETEMQIWIRELKCSNLPPQIISKPIIHATPGCLYRYPLELLMDSYGKFHAYRLTKAPDGMEITDEGIVEWLTPIDAHGHELINVVVENEYGMDSQTYYLAIQEINDRINGDLDADNQFTPMDLYLWSQYWGKPFTNPYSDLNSDKEVNQEDILLLIDLILSRK